MEKIKVLVGYSGNNFSACTDDKDKINGVVVVTSNRFDELKKEMKDAMQFHVEGLLADNDVLPVWLQKGEYEFEYELTAQAILHIAVPERTSLTAIGKATGINVKQLSHYYKGERNPRIEQQKRIIEGIKKIGTELVSIV